MPDLKEIQRICGLLDRGEIACAEFLLQFTRQMALDVGSTRAGVRILHDLPGSRTLRCVAMYDLAKESLVSVPDIVGDAEAAPYFDALVRKGTVSAELAQKNPLTSIFAAGYLVPMDVQSMLDAVLSVNGLMFGTFSCEQVGAPLKWTVRQLGTLRRIASRASLTLLHAVTATIDTAPGSLWDSSSPSRLMTMPLPLDDARR